MSPLGCGTRYRLAPPTPSQGSIVVSCNSVRSHVHLRLVFGNFNDATSAVKLEVQVLTTRSAGPIEAVVNARSTSRAGELHVDRLYSDTSSGTFLRMSGVTVRRATIADLATMLVMVGEYCASDGHIFDERKASSGLEPLLGGDSVGTAWIIEPDGYAIVTWAWSLEIGGLEAVLDEIYVRSSGNGVGATALAIIEHDCRKREVKRIFLETERPNTAARRFYSRNGYVEDDSIWMSKDLD